MPVVITHATPADGTFSAAGAIAWGETHVVVGDGLTGATGAAGATGPTGVAGLTGALGATGAAGAQGTTGPTGVGLTGAQGLTGVAGPTGVQGLTGAIGPSGPTGADSTVPGPTGPSGPAGPTGVGLTGAQGPTGALGLTGAIGPTGPSGPSGPEGPTGPANGPSMRGVLANADKVASLATTLTHPSLFFTVTTGAHLFKFRIPWNAGTAGANGCKVGLLFPAINSCGIVVQGMIGVGGTATNFEDQINNSGKFITFASAPSLVNNVLLIDGVANFSAAGTLHVIMGAEAIATASGITFKAGASGLIWAMQ